MEHHVPSKEVIRAPRNREAAKAYNQEYGKLLAQEKVNEVKAANFGRLTVYDRQSTLLKLPSRKGYTIGQTRKNIYEKAIRLFESNELIRPIINLIVSSIFSSGAPDIRGSNKELVESTRELIEFNKLNFHDIARDAELSGDCFLWFKPNGSNTEIVSLDPSEVKSVLADGDLRKLTGYEVTGIKALIPPTLIEHLKFNSTSVTQYGNSSLKHLFYYADVLDELFEKNWLRGAQYYGNPLIVLTGVPRPYQEGVKNEIEGQTQRAGRSWVLPENAKVEVPDFTQAFPIGDIVGWVFRMISIGTEIPITLLGTADAASRGSAFFANPRFVLAINPRREVWRLGLRSFFIKIFRETGQWKGDKNPTRKEFDIGFPIIFDRDLTDIADVMAIYAQHKTISKKSMMEKIGLDYSDELEQMKAEDKEEVFKQEIPSDGTLDPVAKARRDARRVATNGKKGDDE